MKTLNHKLEQNQSKQIHKDNPSFNKNQIIQGHILKFIKKGKPHQDRGIICYPQQTYGVSEQSPSQFKLSYGLVGQNGYIYKHQDKPQFKYYSQKRYFSIDGSTDEKQSAKIHFSENRNHEKSLQHKSQLNPQQHIFKFHRKKGRLTDFVDKNGWMSKTVKMIGFQRNDVARQLQKKDRKQRIQSLKPKIKYQNKSAYRPDTSAQYFRTIGSLTSRKMKIRIQRNNEAQRFSQSIQPRNIQTSHHRNKSHLEKQSIQQRMLQTARDFSPSRITSMKRQNFLNKTFHNSKNRLYRFQKTYQKDNESREYNWRENYEQSLQDWYRTTCSSKWVYKKAADLEEDRENEAERRMQLSSRGF